MAGREKGHKMPGVPACGIKRILDALSCSAHFVFRFCLDIVKDEYPDLVAT
jgi:hypothetical protein